MKTIITQSIDEAAALLDEGKLVAIPTETVYGLAGKFGIHEVHNEIYKVKGRPADNPLIVHIGDVSWVKELTNQTTPFLEPLMQHFFPGPLTLILKKASHISEYFCAGLDTIAIRMPEHPIARAILKKVNIPLVAPSANLSGKPSPTSSMDVYEDLNGKIPLIVEGGRCQIGIESTVVSLIEDKPRVLRPGIITQKEIEHVLGFSVECGGKGRCISPGMKYRHYAPKTPIQMFTDLEDVQECSLQSWILSYEGELPGSIPFSSYSLYQKFREADRLNISKIYIYLSSNLLNQTALMNRIQKAANQA